MSRGVGRLGYGNDTAGAITPAALTAAYPYKQIYFPACVMALDAVDPAIFQTIQIGSLEKSFDVITYVDAANTEVSWNYALKDAALDEADPQFKLFPVWFQALDVADPGDTVLLEGYIQNCLMTNSLDRTFAAPTGQFITSPTQAQWDVAGGDGTSVENSIDVDNNYSGDALVASGTNLLQFQFERHGTDVEGDTYDKEVHMLGVIFQYKTKFANVAQWPV